MATPTSPLLNYIQKNGRTPPIQLNIYPLNAKDDSDPRPQVQLTQFLQYQFSSSVLIPVDAFTFTFTMPSQTVEIYDNIVEGDTVQLVANGTIVCTGRVDTVDIETTTEGGDVVTIMGRNLLGKLEDDCAVNTLQNPMWGNNISLYHAVGAIIQGSNLRGLIDQNSPKGNFLFATSPGESKMSALMRFIEPLNCLIWGDPEGYIVVGRPDQGLDAEVMGDIVCDRFNRVSNVNSIKAIRNSTQIPNLYLPVWTGQENVQTAIHKSQVFLNPADGPKTLRLKGYNVQKCIITSSPQGSDPQSLSDTNQIQIANGQLLQAYAIREMYRDNMHELIVQANVKGHYNDNLDPFLIDQVYNVNYSRAGVRERMYLYQVDYSCDAETGPKTSLNFCKLGTIVAGINTKSIAQSIINSGVLPIL